MKYHPLSSEEAEEVVELEVVDAVALVTSKTMQTKRCLYLHPEENNESLGNVLHQLAVRQSKCFSSMDGRVGNDRVIRVILLVVE